MQNIYRTVAVWFTVAMLSIQSVVPAQGFGCGCSGECASAAESVEQACGCCSDKATDGSKSCCCSQSDASIQPKTDSDTTGIRKEATSCCEVSGTQTACSCGVEDSIPAIAQDGQRAQDSILVLSFFALVPSLDLPSAIHASRQSFEISLSDATAPPSAQVLFCIWLT